ncbi:MAG: DUF4411 family protein [Chloroflexi bacterium]|nr:DUF4411 family protein [Chloroflexota bacterium]
MFYLLDANVLIDAHDKYYPIDQLPQFWEWIIEKAKQNRIKMPFEMLAEVKAGQLNRNKDLDEDKLIRWLKSEDREKDLLYGGSPNRELVNKVFKEGYELTDPSPDELRRIGKDPLLIAYALAISNACIVTLENKQENTTDAMKKHKRSIPFVCRKLKIRSIDTFELIRELHFSTA